MRADLPRASLRQEVDRPELTHALKSLRNGDTLVVWRLDRLGWSLHHLILSVTDIDALGAAFESLTEKIETGSTTGRLVFHLVAALAEFERNLISERAKEGLKEARKRGNRGGRKPVLDAKAAEQVRFLMRIATLVRRTSPRPTACLERRFTSSLRMRPDGNP